MCRLDGTEYKESALNFYFYGLAGDDAHRSKSPAFAQTGTLCGELQSKWHKVFLYYVPSLLPNTLGPVIVNSTLQVAQYILSEASLSFLGMGVPDTVVTWGNIINAAKRLDIIQTMPLLWLAPGITICLLVLSINFFGDGLRDVLDPSAQ